MIEVEDEYGYLADQEKTTPQPTLLYVERSTLAPEILSAEDQRRQNLIPPFMIPDIIPAHYVNATRSKLDSIILKGSKILAKHPNSDYIDGTLYLMAKAYFYKGNWNDAKIKCLEFIENFPRSPLSPEIHLLLSKVYLIQGKFDKARIYLDRTIDIAWGQNRYDILSAAFQYQAAVAIYEKDIENALRPYHRAIAQADDDRQKARWQFDLASLFFRLGMFSHALKEFQGVFNYEPDALLQFETLLYLSQTHAYLQHFTIADSIYTALQYTPQYQQWAEYIAALALQLDRLKKVPEDSLKIKEQKIDGAYPRSLPVSLYFYDRAMDLFEQGKLQQAREYFGKATLSRSPLHFSANSYYSLLSHLGKLQSFITPLLSKVLSPSAQDSLKATVAKSTYEVARTFQKLGLLDSALTYYRLAAEIAPVPSTIHAKSLYTFATVQKEHAPQRADSIFQQLTALYPKNEYGNAARMQLGYTAEAIIDSARELYESAYHLLHAKEYTFALQQLHTLLTKFPHSSYAPQCLYLLGWFYERHASNTDSAYFYYLQLIQRYPETEYAKDVYPAVQKFIAHRFPPDDTNRPQLPQIHSQQSAPQLTPAPGSQNPPLQLTPSPNTVPAHPKIPGNQRPR